MNAWISKTALQFAEVASFHPSFKSERFLGQSSGFALQTHIPAKQHDHVHETSSSYFGLEVCPPKVT